MWQLKLTNINTYINFGNRCYMNVRVEMLLVYGVQSFFAIMHTSLNNLLSLFI